MLQKIFPTVADNIYRGHWIAKWLLIFYVAKSFLAGGIHMFSADGGAQSIASITLDQFTQGGANSLITIFAMWGMEQMVIGLIGVVILLRYQSLIPMMTLVYVCEYLGRFSMSFITPGVVSAHTPPGAVADLVLIPLTVVMFLLSLKEVVGTEVGNMVQKVTS